MKKKFVLIACLCAIFIAIAGLAIINSDSGVTNHNHVWSLWQIVRQSTCTENGLRERMCDCGEKEQEFSNPLGHAPGNDITCSESQTCTRCGAELVAAKGHTVVIDKSVAATCTATGLSEGQHCSVCNEVIAVQQVIAAKGHTELLEMSVAPTCTTIGLTEGKICSDCGEILVAQQVIPAKGHHYDAVVTKPTCTEKGYTTHSCYCGDCYVDTYIDAIGHNYGAWYEIKTPTESESGEQRRDCQSCGAYDIKPIAALAHSHNNWDEISLEAVEPTCTAAGLTEGKKCSGCGEVLVAQEIVPAKGHNMGEWHEVQKPTCTEKGVERGECANCGHFETREIPVTAHNYDATVKKPTCTEQGYTTHTCHCGDSYVDTYVKAKGHSYGEWYETKAPTETKAGEKRKDCQNCDAFKTTPIAALIHRHENWAMTLLEAVAPTCMSTGLSEGQKCSGCGEILVAQEIIPAKGHSLGEWYETKSPTEMDWGEKRRDCQNCDAFETAPVEPWTHSHDRWSTISLAAVAPTCTSTGLTEGSKCAGCGAVLVPQETIPVKNHNVGEWQENQAPTCTEKGIEQRECEDCDYFEKREINPVAHNLSRHEAKDPTCTENGWQEYVTCDREGCDYTTFVAIPAKGTHTWTGEQVLVKGTCTKDAITVYICECGAKETVVLKAEGHKYGDSVTVKEVSCDADGLKKEMCSVCGNELTHSIPSSGHHYIALSEAVVSGILETTYQCEICEKTHVLQGEKVISNIKAEEYIFDCPPDFIFDVVCERDSDYIKKNLVIVQAYDIEQANKLAFTVTSKGNNVWTIAGTASYQGGESYTAILNDEITFSKYDSQKLTFRIAQEEKETLQVKEGIIFLKTLEKQSPGYYPYTTTYSEESNLIWLSVQCANGLNVGDLLCVGDAEDKGDLFQFADTDSKNILGKIQSIYKNENGSYLIALTCPDLSEIFAELDIFQKEEINFEDVDFQASEELQAQMVKALYASRGFAEFLTSVSLGSESYLVARNMDASSASTESLTDRLKIEPHVTIDGTTLKCTLSGNLEIPINSKDGKIEFGSIVISFVAEASFGISIDYSCSIDWLSENSKLEINLIQTSEFGFAFDVVIDMDYTQAGVELGEFVYNFATLTVHNAKCKHVAQIKDKHSIVMITSEEAVKYLHEGKAKECGTCSPIYALNAQSYVINKSTKVVHQYPCSALKNATAGNLMVSNLGIDELKKAWNLCDQCHPEQREAADFTARLQNSAKYEKWEDTLNKVGEKLNEAIDGEPLTDDMKLGHLDFKIKLMQVNVDLFFELQFHFDATIDLDYRIKQQQIYGIGIYGGKFRTWESESKELLEESLEIVGKITAEAGLRVDLYASVRNLEDWAKFGIYGRIGVYAEAEGILHIDNVANESYAGAYFETGIYTDFGYFYKFVNWGGRASLTDKTRIPLVELGVSKVYYSYSDTIGGVLISSDYTFDADDLLQVTYYDLRRGKTVTETLSFDGVDGVYTVTLRLKDGKYCHLEGNVIVIHEDAPAKFSDILYVSVTGLKGWGKYLLSNSAFNLGEYEVGIEFDGDAHPWKEVDRQSSTCMEFGWIDYACPECHKTKREILDKADHQYGEDWRCLVCNVAAWENNEIQYVNSEQRLVTHLGFYGLYQDIHDQLDLSSLSRFFTQEYVITFSVYVNMQIIDEGQQEFFLYDRSFAEIGRYKQDSQYNSSEAISRGMIADYAIPVSGTGARNHSFDIEIEGSKCRPVMTLCYDASGTGEDDWYCNYVEIIISVRQADWVANRVTFNGHTYYVFSGDDAGYQKAEAYCESLGGYMATITSQEENDFLYAYIKSLGYTDVYFGLSDAAREGGWVWSNGEVSSYNNWAPGEPNSSKEDYAMFYSGFPDGKWNDGDFNNGVTLGGSRLFICEWGDYETPTNDLEYAMYSDGTGFIVTGIGDFTGSHLIIPDVYCGLPVWEIEAEAFYECKSITQITIGRNVKKIGAKAFYGCTEVSRIQYNAEKCADFGSKNMVFYQVGRNTSGVILIIGSSVKETPTFLMCSDYNIENTPNIVWVVFEGNSSCTYIDNCLLEYCATVQSVVLPDSVTSVGTYIFGRCQKLTYVKLSENMKEISAHMFEHCQTLEELYIPVSVRSIKDYAFLDCPAFTTVYYGGTQEQWNSVSKSSRDNQALSNATVYFYSETEPELNKDGTAYDGNYWHYNIYGEIVVWELFS